MVIRLGKRAAIRYFTSTKWFLPEFPRLYVLGEFLLWSFYFVIRSGMSGMRSALFSLYEV